MTFIFDHPIPLFLIAVAVQWMAAYAGDFIRRRAAPAEAIWADLDLVRAATLTLLGLIIGFTFQMAINRYDQRKTYEREEANAIGTEYLRADLLPAEDTGKVRPLLTKYLQQRLLFYTTDDGVRGSADRVGKHKPGECALANSEPRGNRQPVAAHCTRHRGHERRAQRERIH